MKPDRTHIVTSSRLKLTVQEWGDPEAPPLILQHGGRDHARSWDFVAAAFAKHYRVLAPDLRGHGDSEWTNDGQYSIVDLVYDLGSVIAALELEYRQLDSTRAYAMEKLAEGGELEAARRRHAEHCIDRLGDEARQHRRARFQRQISGEA